MCSGREWNFWPLTPVCRRSSGHRYREELMQSRRTLAWFCIHRAPRVSGGPFLEDGGERKAWLMTRYTDSAVTNCALPRRQSLSVHLTLQKRSSATRIHRPSIEIEEEKTLSRGGLRKEVNHVKRRSGTSHGNESNISARKRYAMKNLTSCRGC